MAGAGGTGKPAGPKQPTIDDLREMLIPEIIKQLSGPMPQAPQYQPAPISPQQGYAMARNPQAAGLINQTIQGPGQAQYMQQQEAFKAAMEGRHQAFNVAATLTGQESRLDEATMRALATANKPQAAEKPREILTTHPDGSQWIFNLDTNTERRAGGAGKPPTEATVTARTSFETTKENLRLLKNMALASGGTLQERLGATVQRGLSHIPGNEMFSSQANVNDYNAIVNDLGTQLRAVYGAQGIRAIQEIQLLLKNLPPYGSSPELINQRFSKIDSIIAKLEQERQRMQPSAFPPETPAATVDPKALAEEYMQKYGGR